MTRRSTSKLSKEIEIDPSTKSKIDKYTAQIVSLQAENINLNNENQVLAEKFNKLTEYNQTLGDDLANFDEEIVNLEQTLQIKTTQYQKLIKRVELLDQQIIDYRKSLMSDQNFSNAALKLKKLEEKKKAIFKRLDELNENPNCNGTGIIETRALLLEHIKSLEQTNTDLVQQKALLKFLLDKDKTVAQKKAALNEMIKKKNEEQSQLLSEIHQIRKNPKETATELLKSSVFHESQGYSEFADDEENDQEIATPNTKNATSTHPKNQSNDQNNPSGEIAHQNEQSDYSSTSIQQKSKNSTKKFDKSETNDDVQHSKSKRSNHNDSANPNDESKSATHSDENKLIDNSRVEKSQHNDDNSNVDDGHKQKKVNQNSESESLQSDNKLSSKKQKIKDKNQQDPRRIKTDSDSLDNEIPIVDDRPSSSRRSKKDDDELSKHSSNKPKKSENEHNQKRKKPTKLPSLQLSNNNQSEHKIGAVSKKESQLLSNSNSIQKSTNAKKKVPDNYIDIETQINEHDFNPIVKNRSITSSRESEARNKLNSLKKEIETKLKEKEELQKELNKPPPVFELSNKKFVSIAPLPDAIHDLSLNVFKHRNLGSQTEITGESIDFHMKLLEKQLSELNVTSDLQDEIQNLQNQIKIVNDSIAEAKIEGENRDQQIKKVKNDLKCAKANIESEQQNQDLETRRKNEILAEIETLRSDIREKQDEFEAQTIKNREMQEKLDELIKIRNALERDIEDMSMRERPEIQTLSDQVHTYQGRVVEAQSRLQKAEEELETKRDTLMKLKKSPNIKTYKDLVIRKIKLERRLNKWKMLLKDSKESMQSLEAFSSQNYQKRAGLVQTLEKYEREKADKEEELRDLESYSTLLNALIHEQNENWS